MEKSDSRAIVFYSWQSDLPNRTNRSFIQTALERAVKAIRNDDSVRVEPVVDRDTQGIPGAPMIAETILAKIDSASVFVGDVSIIGKTEFHRPTPNPNVVHELGYARKALGTDRLIMICNEAYGAVKDLPFDLRHRLVLPYRLSEDASAEDRASIGRNLQLALEEALRRILAMPARQTDIPPSRQALQGVRILRDVAAKALGPLGGRAVYQSDERTQATRDGLVIARRYWSPNLFERHGMDRLNDVAEEMRIQAGDGSKTAMLLSYEIIRGGYEAVAAGSSLGDVLKGIEGGTKLAVEYLRQNSTATSDKELSNVAQTAGGDVGELVVSAVKQAGTDGGLMIENQSVPSKSNLQTRHGFWVPEGYVSHDFANDPETGNAVLNDCSIIICERKISSIREVLTLLNKLVEAKRSVAIVAEDFENEVVASLLENNEKGVLSSVAVRLPRSREQLRTYFKDLAIATGGHVIGGYFGPSFESAELGDLGGGERVIVTSESMQILNGHAETNRVKTHIAQLRQLMNRLSSYEAIPLRVRIANLLGNVTVIEAGGRTRSDLEDRRYRMETSLASCRLAAASGFVIGGGIALLRAKTALEQSQSKVSNDGELAGIAVIAGALEEPLRCLMEKAGIVVEAGLKQLREFEPDFGLNVTSGRIESLRTQGILDATDVVIAAIEIASLQARTILQTASWELLLNPRHLPWVSGT